MYIKGKGGHETLMSVYYHNDALHKVSHFGDSLNLLVCDGASLHAASFLPSWRRSGSFHIFDVEFFPSHFCHFEPKRDVSKWNSAQAPDELCA